MAKEIATEKNLSNDAEMITRSITEKPESKSVSAVTSTNNLPNVTFNIIRDSIDFKPVKGKDITDIGYDVKVHHFMYVNGAGDIVSHIDLEAEDHIDAYENSVTLRKGESVIIHTGVSLNMTENNTDEYFLSCEVHSRSGLGFKNSVESFNGQIDNTYQKAILLKVTNNGKGKFTINKGDRIAQIEFKKVPKINEKENYVDNLEDLDNDTRGGFGSTGI